MSGQCISWPNCKEEYELKDLIGVGATAVVYAAYCKPRQEKCAIKIINLEKRFTNIEELYKEIKVMASCRHENIVNYYTSFVVKEELWLVLSLLERGSLLDVIKLKMRTADCKNGVFDESTIATVLKEVLKGLVYIHCNGQIHRDIKAGNILLGKDGSIQMADFGVSALLASENDSTGQRVRYTFVGTPCWMAPEVLEQDSGYDFKADIWSFGITAIELATGTAPYHKYPPMKVIMLTMQNDPPKLDKHQYTLYSKTFRKMITACLRKDPTKRPTAQQLLKHPFFKKALDRNHILQTLVDIGPSLGETVDLDTQKCSTAVSGHLKTNLEKWVWSSQADDAPSLDVDCDKPMNDLGGGDTSSESDIDLAENESTAPLNLVLRLRNDKRELNDIRFEFVLGKDTAGGIVSDMEGSGLVDPRDVGVIADNIQQFIQTYGSRRSVTFPLAHRPGQEEASNEGELIGFANLLVQGES